MSTPGLKWNARLRKTIPPIDTRWRAQANPFDERRAPAVAKITSSVQPSVLVRELPPAFEGYGLKVIIGIATSVRNGSITDLEISDFFRRLIDEAVRIASACFEACAHTRRQLGSTFVGVQRGPPTENKDEFVLRRMRMPQGRTRAWRQASEVDTKVGQTKQIAKRPLLPTEHSRRKWFWIV
jgi:hypothetical protein